MKPKCKIVFGVLFSLILATILGGCNGDDSTGVLVRGQVDDGTASSPIGAAKCLYLNENQRLLAQATANASGEFVLRAPPDVSGFLGCYPDTFPNLLLTTYLSTIGSIEGEFVPSEGFEEISPRTTVAANRVVPQ